MSKWTHRCCNDCFNKRHPGKIPSRIKNDDELPCCYCAEFTSAGIYDRNDSNETPCKGGH